MTNQIEAFTPVPQGAGSERAGEGGAQGAPGVVEFAPTFDRCYVPSGTVRIEHGENCDCDFRRSAAERAEAIAVWGLLTLCSASLVVAVISSAIRGWR